MGDKPDWEELLADYDAHSEALKYGLRTKVDKDTHDEVEEWANHLSNGNLSGMVRTCIIIALEELRKGRADIAPSLAKAAHGRRKWLKKQNAIGRLQRASMELRQRHDPDYEAAMKKYAEEEGLQWPLQGYQVQVDPVLKRVAARLKTVSQEQENISLRDVYKGMSGISADEARIAVLELEKMGAVQIAGSRETRGTMEITWCEASVGD